MQRLEPDDKSLVNNFTCKVPQTISITPEGQAEEAIPTAMLCACELKIPSFVYVGASCVRGLLAIKYDGQAI